MDDTKIEGFLRKNRAGMPFAKMSNRRYFTTEGFTVFYYADATKSKVKGHFDLRNVQGLMPSEDPGVGEGAVDVLIWDANGPQKRMVISFSAEKERRDAWLRHWTSAVEAKYVEETLLPLRDEALAATLNGSYGHTDAVAPTRALLFKRAPTTKVMTPRNSALRAQYGDGGGDSAAGTAARDGLDTPRVGNTELPATAAPKLPMPEGTPPKPPVKPAVGPADDDEVTYEITVPEGVQPGDKLQATTPSGVKVKLAVPAGALPGTILTFALPVSVGGEDKEAKAAVIIQAHIRGKAVRSASKPTKPIVIHEPPEVVLAATKLQSTFRGHATRNEQQEASRLQWMGYYMQPEVAEWEEALKLAVTQEEEEQIAAAKAGIAYEEEKRTKWFHYYLSNADYDKAAELVVFPTEKALVLKAKASVTKGPCAC